jgi:plasmid maintenance system antidote protein VapI
MKKAAPSSTARSPSLADTVLRLERYFGVAAQTWSNLQSSFELRLAERQLRAKIERAVKPCSVVA